MFRFTNLVILEITRDCNLKCKYCLMTDKHLFKGEILEFNLFKKIINKIIQERVLSVLAEEDYTGPNTFNLILHGGEPFLTSKNFIKYAEYAYTVFTSYGITLYLGTQTNGILLNNNDFLKFLKKDGFSVGVSFDGFEGANSYRLKNSDQSDAIYASTFKVLKNNNINAGIIAVVHDKNIDKLETIESLVEQTEGTTYTYLPAEDPYGEGEFEVFDQLFDKVYKRQINKFVKHQAVDGKFMKKIEMTFHDIIAFHKQTYKSGCYGKICGSAIGMISVRPDGKSGYCDRFVKDMDYNFIKNAIDFDFLSIHQLKKAVDFATTKHKCLLQTGCDSCRAGYMCDYGCLAFTYSSKNKFEIEKYKTCDINLKVYDYIKSNFIELATIAAENNVSIRLLEEFYGFKQDTLDLLRKNNLKIKLDDKKTVMSFQKIQGDQKNGKV